MRKYLINQVILYRRNIKAGHRVHLLKDSELGLESKSFDLE